MCGELPVSGVAAVRFDPDDPPRSTRPRIAGFFFAHANGVRGSVIFWIGGALLALLAALLFLPARCRIRLHTDRRGGGCEAELYQGFWRLRFFYRICLTEAPCFTVCHIRRDGRAGRTTYLLKRASPRPALPGILVSALHVEELHFRLTLGLSGEPYVTALLAGLLYALAEEAGKAYLPETKRNICVSPDFIATLCRLNMEGMIGAVPAKVILIIVREWRKKRAASD